MPSLKPLSAAAVQLTHKKKSVRALPLTDFWKNKFSNESKSVR
jgi:hypothetical protein